MIMSCLVSIIVPVYNVEAYLDRCLQSIAGQQGVSFEVILVDDGSTDSSAEICDSYSAADSRFKTIHKSNSGVSSARNIGLQYAEGEYVMFVDSDDALAPESLSRLMAVTDNGSVDMVVGGFISYLDSALEGVCVPSATSSYHEGEMCKFFENVMNEAGELMRGPWAKIYRRSVISLKGLRFNESLSYAEDKLFVYAFLVHAGCAAAVAAPVYEYYRRSGSLSWGKTTEKRAGQILEMLPEYYGVFTDLLSRFPDSERLGKVYHNDLFCGDLMRVFRIYMKKKTTLLTEGNLKMMYAIMDSDRMLTLFERKVPCQIFTVALYRLHSVKFTKVIYKMTSAVLSCIIS